MATLNTLRTRFGVLLSAVIAFALLAFIFSLKSEMGFGGNDPVVATIDGEELTYSHYQREYENVMRLSGVSEVDERMAQMLSNLTWQTLVNQMAIEPSLEEMGFDVSEAERVAIISGDVPTQMLLRTFADPQTGQFDKGALTQFLISSQANPEAQQVWNTMMQQAISERITTKYSSLVARGAYANALEVEQAVEASKQKMDGRWAIKRYSSLPDSVVNIDKAFAQNFYNENKSLYKKEPSRTISYARFPIAPSAEDKAQIETEAEELTKELRAAEDVRAFLRAERKGSITPNFLTKAELVDVEADVLSEGKTFGPQKNGEVWRMSRVSETITAPDSLTLSHIVLSYTDEKKADSLLVALRSGADFGEAAKENSLYTQTAQNGGDLGTTPFSALTDEFVDALKGAKTGDVVKIEISDMIQLVKVTKTGKKEKQYRVASIELPIVASDKTRIEAHNKAGLFVAEASEGGKNSFQRAADETKVSARSAELSPSMRSVSAIAGSYELTRWANNAQVGDLSQIFKVDDGYCVAMLTKIDNEEYRSFEATRPEIEQTLRNKGKATIIKSQIAGSTFEEQLNSLELKNSDEFKNVNRSTFAITGLSGENALIGAISATKSVGLGQPVEGNSGVIIFEVQKINDTSEDAVKAEDEKVRLESISERMLQYSAPRALESMLDIEDNRGAVL